MSQPPSRPKIYHITHVHNLPAIVADGGLVSDRKIVNRGGPANAIGMSTIKHRRMKIKVACHPGTKVGDYVPLYFCPRSVMLYVIHKANHPELEYRGGQGPILHLEADLHSVVQWAERHDVRWAFSLSNAGAYYTEFRARVEDLDQLDWQAIAAEDFRRPEVKESKQAEFLLHDRFPFSLVERIGVRSSQTRDAALKALGAAQPPVEIQPGWYY